jgi:hypothetical protein
VREGNVVFFDDQYVPADEVLPRLYQLHQANANIKVSISADPLAMHGDVITVLDEVRRVGITKVGYQIRTAAPADAQPGAPPLTSPTPIPTVTPQVAPAKSPTIVKPMPGERFPQTRSRLMTASDVESWTAAQIRYAANEMYARYGADFLDPQIKRHFTAFEWYHPHSGQTYDETEKLFSPMEMENLKLLGFYRDARKAGVPPTLPSGGGR